MKVMSTNWNHAGKSTTIGIKTCVNVPQLGTDPSEMESESETAIETRTSHCPSLGSKDDISLNSIVRTTPTGRKLQQSVPPFDGETLHRVHQANKTTRQQQQQQGEQHSEEETDDMSLWNSIRRQVETLSKPLEDTINKRINPVSMVWSGSKEPSNTATVTSHLTSNDTTTSERQSPAFETARSCRPSPALDLSRVPTNETVGFKRLNESTISKDHLSMKAAMANSPNIETPSNQTEDSSCPYGFSFSPAGLLLPYHFGVLDYLIHAGMVDDNTPLAGASAGSIASLVGGIKRDIRTEIIPHLFKLEANLRLRGTGQRLAKEVRAILEDVIQEDDHEKLNNRPQPAAVVYTTIMPWRGHSVHSFSSKKDLIQCLLASCNIPFYFQKSPTVKCRGRHCVDGYFSDRKNFGCPTMTNVKNQVRVLPFSAVTVVPHLAPHEYISPDLSIFDNNIPEKEYEAFMQYMRDFPAPQPSVRTDKAPMPTDNVEPAPVLGFSQEPQVNLPPDRIVEPMETDDNEMGNGSHPIIPVIKISDLNEENQTSPSDDRTKSSVNSKLEPNEQEEEEHIKSQTTNQGPQPWDVNTAEPHLMMITRAKSNVLSEGNPRSRHISISRKSQNLFRDDISRDMDALNIQTPLHYPIITRSPHENNRFGISDDAKAFPNNSSEKRGIFRRLLRRRPRERSKSKEGDASSRSQSISKSGDEADPDSERTTWSFWGLGQKGFLSAWVSSISDGKSEDNNPCSNRLDMHPHPTQVTSYSLLQKPRRSGVLRRRRAPVPEPKYPGLPIPRLGWRTLIHYAMNPTDDDEEVRELFNLGRTDAFRWVQLNKKRNENESLSI